MTTVAAWPPFRLVEGEQPAAALLDAATMAGIAVRMKTAGPSDTGNALAGEGIAATATGGVLYKEGPVVIV
ncbi:hypothetical protein ACQEVS_33180 [Streptomyces sp. CA-181903]|uniref:hypothetical protein n=1 Tax=Streptomyces sp. CA-181903 TaxID=3240055 RepID=UPI003D9040A0